MGFYFNIKLSPRRKHVDVFLLLHRRFLALEIQNYFHLPSQSYDPKEWLLITTLLCGFFSI